MEESKKIKITVIRRFSPEEVFGHEMKYTSGEKVAPCSRNGLSEGMEWVVEYMQRPENFCVWAWRDLSRDLSILFCGGDHFWSEPDVTYTSCSDGMRPVVFKLERLK
ncbi:MAG: TIGR04076 family protein [Promethearchaeota archaeon]|jgi:uncharacterized repeat protein (TIGR04076 family)